MNRGSPPTKEATRPGLNPNRDAKTENLDGPKLNDSAPSGNRQVLEKAADAHLWAVTEGRRTHYQVTSGKSTWTFNLLNPRR